MYVVWDFKTNLYVLSNDEGIWGDMYVLCEELIDFVLSLYLMMLFVHELLLVIVDLDDSRGGQFVNSQAAVLNAQQKALINLLTKYCILSFIATMPRLPMLVHMRRGYHTL